MYILHSNKLNNFACKFCILNFLILLFETFTLLSVIYGLLNFSNWEKTCSLGGKKVSINPCSGDRFLRSLLVSQGYHYGIPLKTSVISRTQMKSWSFIDSDLILTPEEDQMLKLIFR